MHLIVRDHIVELLQQLVRLLRLRSNSADQLLALLLVLALLSGDLLRDVVIARVLDGQCLVRLLQSVHGGLVDHSRFDRAEIDFRRSLRVGGHSASGAKRVGGWKVVGRRLVGRQIRNRQIESQIAADHKMFAGHNSNDKQNGYLLSQACLGLRFQFQVLALLGLTEQAADLRPVDA